MPINLNELKNWLQEIRTEWRVPGMAVAVVLENAIKEVNDLDEEYFSLEGYKISCLK